MSDVLLIHPSDSFTRGFVGDMPPLGLAWLATALETSGHSVRIVDMQVDPAPIDEVLLRERPAVVGIGGTTVSRFEAFACAARAREILPRRCDRLRWRPCHLRGAGHLAARPADRPRRPRGGRGGALQGYRAHTSRRSRLRGHPKRDLPFQRGG